jgi:hypothetical protein
VTDRTAAARQALQRERDRAFGLKEVTVKVPAERMPEIRRIAAEMRKQSTETGHRLKGRIFPGEQE